MTLNYPTRIPFIRIIKVSIPAWIRKRRKTFTDRQNIKSNFGSREQPRLDDWPTEQHSCHFPPWWWKFISALCGFKFSLLWFRCNLQLCWKNGSMLFVSDLNSDSGALFSSRQSLAFFLFMKICAVDREKKKP